MLHLLDCQQISAGLRKTRLFALSLSLVAVSLGLVRAQGIIIGPGGPASGPALPNAPVDVTTYAYDNTRSGLNAQEGRLTLKTVNPMIFGRIFIAPVDGQVYAQPLYLHNLPIPGKGVHNVVFVATEHDSVYAFDADGIGLIPGTSPTPLWHVSYINPAMGITTVPNGDTGSGDINPEIGITGTPVIDPKTDTLYVVAKTKENGIYVQRLHALDVHTGAEKPNSPVVIQATVPGTGDGTDGNGNVPFNPLIQHNRPGLLLLNGVVYIAFASHGDNGPYHGWLLGYNATSLKQVAVWNSTPNAVTYGYPLAAGGIWMGGCAPAADAQGNIFFSTGNGTFDLDPTSIYSPAYGDAIVKLSTTNGLTVTDYFAPFDQQILDDGDVDLGSGGLILLPSTMQINGHQNLLIQSGKEGRVSVLDRNNLGKYNSGGDLAAQTLPNAVTGIWGKPSVFNETVYFGGQGDNIKSFGLRTFRSNNYIYNPDFTAQSGLQLNGTAGYVSVTNNNVKSTVLQLTSGANAQISSAFTTNRVNVQKFNTQFLFQMSNAVADGFTFTLQGQGPGAIGSGTTGLGYQGITGSVAIKFDLVDHGDGYGPNTTGLYINGVAPLEPAVSLAGAGINFNSGDPFLVSMSYDGKDLTVTTTDYLTNATAIQVYPVDIPTAVGATLGYAGFTAATGATTNATQNILAWVYYSPTLTTKLFINTGASNLTFGYPGTTPTISAGIANNQLTNGIVWALDVSQWGNGGNSTLYALDASNLGNVLYNSASTNESPGPAIKFTTPVVANGKVYVGSGNSLTVYGPRRLGPNTGGGL